MEATRHNLSKLNSFEIEREIARQKVEVARNHRTAAYRNRISVSTYADVLLAEKQKLGEKAIRVAKLKAEGLRAEFEEAQASYRASVDFLYELACELPRREVVKFMDEVRLGRDASESAAK